MSNAAPRATPVALRTAAAKRRTTVAITYAGHSTYYIDTPGGVRIATDYSGAYQHRPAARRRHHEPRPLHPLHAVSRSAHSRMCCMAGAMTGSPRKIARADRRRLYPQRHHRYPPLFRRRCQWRDDQGRQFDLHLRGRRALHRPSRASARHALDDSHFAAIGRLDIVMVPIDGTYTMSLDGISDITRRLRASVVLPMHRFMHAARGIHAQDRPAIRDRRAHRAHPDDLAGFAAGRRQRLSS